MYYSKGNVHRDLSSAADDFNWDASCRVKEVIGVAASSVLHKGDVVVASGAANFQSAHHLQKTLSQKFGSYNLVVRRSFSCNDLLINAPWMILIANIGKIGEENVDFTISPWPSVGWITHGNDLYIFCATKQNHDFFLKNGGIAANDEYFPFSSVNASDVVGNASNISLKVFVKVDKTVTAEQILERTFEKINLK